MPDPTTPIIPTPTYRDDLMRRFWQGDPRHASENPALIGWSEIVRRAPYSESGLFRMRREGRFPAEVVTRVVQSRGGSPEPYFPRRPVERWLADVAAGTPERHQDAPKPRKMTPDTCNACTDSPGAPQRVAWVPVVHADASTLRGRLAERRRAERGIA